MGVFISPNLFVGGFDSKTKPIEVKSLILKCVIPADVYPP
jgi:hypothetical protein